MTLLRPLPPIADNRNQFRVTVRAENKIFRLRSGVLCTGIGIATFPVSRELPSHKRLRHERAVC
jgi:hypothetical protein